VFKPMDAVSRMAAALGGFMGSTANVISWPKAVMNKWYKMCESSTVSVLNGWHSIEAATGQFKNKDDLIEAMAGLHNARVDALKSFGVAGFKVDIADAKTIHGHTSVGWVNAPTALHGELMVADFSGMMVKKGVDSSLSMIDYVLTASDIEAGLEVLAEFYYGDSTLWVLIGQANGMTDPFTLPNGMPLTAGETIKIPKFAGMKLPPTASTEDYGKDLRLSKDGDLVIQDTDKTELSTISGAPNLHQAMKNRLLTVAGESAAFPGYGLPSFIAERSSAILVGTSAASVRTQVLSDPRMADVDEIVVMDDGDRMIVECRAHAVGSKPIDIVAPLPELA